jgi:hypothetical protein
MSLDTPTAEAESASMIEQFATILTEPLLCVAEANNRFVLHQRELETARNTQEATVYVSRINRQQVLTVDDYTAFGSRMLYTQLPPGRDVGASLDLTLAEHRLAASGLWLSPEPPASGGVACRQKEYCFDAEVVRTLRSTRYVQNGATHRSYDAVARSGSHLAVDSCRYKLTLAYTSDGLSVLGDSGSTRQGIELDVHCTARAPSSAGVAMDDKLAAQLLEHNAVLPIVQVSGGGGERSTRRLNKLRDVVLRVCSLLRDPAPSPTESVGSQRLYQLHATIVAGLPHTEYTDTMDYLWFVVETVQAVLDQSAQALKLFAAPTSPQALSFDFAGPGLEFPGEDPPEDETSLFAMIDAALATFSRDTHDHMTQWFGRLAKVPGYMTIPAYTARTTLLEHFEQSSAENDLLHAILDQFDPTVVQNVATSLADTEYTIRWEYLRAVRDACVSVPPDNSGDKEK